MNKEKLIKALKKNRRILEKNKNHNHDFYFSFKNHQSILKKKVRPTVIWTEVIVRCRNCSMSGVVSPFSNIHSFHEEFNSIRSYARHMLSSLTHLELEDCDCKNYDNLMDISNVMKQ